MKNMTGESRRQEIKLMWLLKPIFQVASAAEQRCLAPPSNARPVLRSEFIVNLFLKTESSTQPNPIIQVKNGLARLPCSIPVHVNCL